MVACNDLNPKVYADRTAAGRNQARAVLGEDGAQGLRWGIFAHE